MGQVVGSRRDHRAVALLQRDHERCRRSLPRPLTVEAIAEDLLGLNVEKSESLSVSETAGRWSLKRVSSRRTSSCPGEVLQDRCDERVGIGSKGQRVRRGNWQVSATSVWRHLTRAEAGHGQNAFGGRDG